MKPDEPYTYQDFIWASSHFLTETLPPEYKDWSDEELDDFVDDNRWEPFEHHPTNEIINLIDSLAFSVREYIKEVSKL